MNKLFIYSNYLLEHNFATGSPGGWTFFLFQLFAIATLQAPEVNNKQCADSSILACYIRYSFILSHFWDNASCVFGLFFLFL